MLGRGSMAMAALTKGNIYLGKLAFRSRASVPIIVEGNMAACSAQADVVLATSWSAGNKKGDVAQSED